MPTVLIVNDDPAFLDALAQVLKMESYTIATATSCLEAVQLADTFGPEIIVSDYEMGEGDGVTFLETLRDRGLCLNVPKFLLSGADTGEIKRRLRAAGLDVPILSKAGSVDRLLQAIRGSAQAQLARPQGLSGR
jgi:CheY-like chemotaxis protein